jgi:hypothetical protein
MPLWSEVRKSLLSILCNIAQNALLVHPRSELKRMGGDPGTMSRRAHGSQLRCGCRNWLVAFD